MKLRRINLIRRGALIGLAATRLLGQDAATPVNVLIQNANHVWLGRMSGWGAPTPPTLKPRVLAYITDVTPNHVAYRMSVDYQDFNAAHRHAETTCGRTGAMTICSVDVDAAQVDTGTSVTALSVDPVVVVVTLQ